MFCPKCSQEQSLEEMRFCSRCGFPLGGVALLLDNEGDVTKVSNPTAISSNRVKVMVEAGIFTLIAWSLALAATLLWDQGGPAEVFARVASMIFGLLGLIGLIRFAYAYLFMKSSTGSVPEQKTFARSDRSALPPQQSVPAREFAKRSDTKEMMPRGSVTENTTRLLKDD